jgi:hypothetical protein
MTENALFHSLHLLWEPVNRDTSRMRTKWLRTLSLSSLFGPRHQAPRESDLPAPFH